MWKFVFKTFNDNGSVMVQKEEKMRLTLFLVLNIGLLEYHDFSLWPLMPKIFLECISTFFFLSK